MKTTIARRQFLKRSAISTAGVWLAGGLTSFGKISPNEKLNIAMVGTGNRAGENINSLMKDADLINIVALCDVDDLFLAPAAKRFPNAKLHRDFRKMLEQSDIDAVLVATPDHIHAVAAVAALKSGRHVYCEKPLARTVSETRIITETAAKMKKVTQIGTQIHAGANYRRVVELVQSGAIGTINEVHVWVPATYGGKPRPTDNPPVPPELDYDLWLGPVDYVPYSPEYVPFKWRNWWNFGGGALADFGCHFMDLPHWALGLRQPKVIEVIDGPPVSPDYPPPWLIVRYEHPAHGAQPAVKVTWYHGGKRPDFIGDELYAKWKGGVYFMGTKGQLLADYNRHVLLPEKDFADFTPPKPFVADSIGHHKEWVEAIRTGSGKTTCSFDYSGPLTETALLGNVSYRVGKKLEWDNKAMRATNCKEANTFLYHHYRKGWKI